MDPPLISEGSFATANPSLAEIWPLNGGGRGGEVGEMTRPLGLSVAGDGAEFAAGMMMGGFIEGSIEESTVTKQNRSVAGGGGRKRRGMAMEDESSRMLSAATPKVLEIIGNSIEHEASNCSAPWHAGKFSLDGNIELQVDINSPTLGGSTKVEFCATNCNSDKLVLHGEYCGIKEGGCFHHVDRKEQESTKVELLEPHFKGLVAILL